MKKIVLLLMSAMVMFLAISCNKDNSNDNDIVGTWKDYLDESYCYDSEGNVVWEDKFLASEEEYYCLVFEDNGTGKYRGYDKWGWLEAPLTYSLNGNTLYLSIRYEDGSVDSSRGQIEKLTADELVLKTETFNDGAVQHVYLHFVRIK